MELIRSIYEDDPDMMEIVREFVAELPDRIADLQGGIEAADWPKLQTLAHQLKGAGGGYGFPQITEVAASFEQSLKEGSDESLTKDRCEQLCNTLRAAEVSEVA